MPKPVSDQWKGWPLDEKLRLLLKLRERDLRPWRERARPDQIPPDDFTTFFVTGGRGSGKTWPGAHILAEELLTDPFLEADGPGEWAVIAPTFADARDKCIEGESGLLAALYTSKNEVEAGISPTVKTWNRSLGELILRNGQHVFISGADDGAPKIQGLNLRGAWCDEIGLWKKWKEAFDESLTYALRKGRARKVITGTPKRDRPARVLVKRLMDDPNVVTRRLLTKDNMANLSPVFLEEVMKTANTSLGRQELEGLMLDEAEGALWKRNWIDLGRIASAPDSWIRKILALDPADGGDQSDEQAWVLVGTGENRDFYVLESEGMRTTPTAWLTAAVKRARDANAAIVVEKNHGGQFLMNLLDKVMDEVGVKVPVLEVNASDGKRTRAEAPAMLYEQGFNTGTPRVHHVGDLPELEDQMVNWTGEPGLKSPDRLDALVWGLSELMARAEAPKKRVLTV